MIAKPASERRTLELAAASARALSGQANLRYRGRRMHQGGQALPVYAAHLHPNAEDDFASHRGAADGVALRLRFTDTDLHYAAKPPDPVESLLFDAFEQFRVEAITPSQWPGVRHNLSHRFEAWTRQFFGSGLLETESGMLLFTISVIARAGITQQPIPEETEDAMESTRASILPHVGRDLRAMRKLRFDQALFAAHALSVAKWLGQRMHELSEGRDEAQRKISSLAAAAAFKLLTDWDGELEQGIRPASSGRSSVLESAQNQYKIFTTAFDKISKIQDLVKREELEEYRKKLDQKVLAQGVNLPRLARDLLVRIAQPHRGAWRFGQEQGRIDGRRLAQLVSSPNERAVFRDERIEPLSNCSITFLIDCSGSMKAHIEVLAMLIDLLSRACDQAGIANEVLGFTTGAWHGGRAQKAWLKAGRPEHPGRLNEVQHLVFKDAKTPWRRARRGIAGLLKSEIFREGIDGEAVGWAAQRAQAVEIQQFTSQGSGAGLQAPESSRRILMVISDACPMDGATQLANDAFYLDQHLKEVVTQVETRGEVQICALGVGLDLSPYYRYHRSVDFSAPPGNQVFGEILTLIAALPQPL